MRSKFYTATRHRNDYEVKMGQAIVTDIRASIFAFADRFSPTARRVPAQYQKETFEPVHFSNGVLTEKSSNVPPQRIIKI